MNILTLAPAYRSVQFEYLKDTDRKVATSGKVENFATHTEALETIAAALADYPADHHPDRIAVRVAFGGRLFRSAAVVDDRVVSGLHNLIPGAPLHIPALLALLEACRVRYSGVPIVLVFETAFFADLPERESTYGIDSALADSLRLRRSGYHGIFHQAASGIGAPERILSICLEPEPEVAAVMSGRPVMVTGGSTPLEGLPGQSTCGEIDPTIILALAQDMKLGTEQIDLLLTHESGLRALGDPSATVGEVLKSNDESNRLARNVLRYRMLLAIGAGQAAMGGIDEIVFSGRFADAGTSLMPWIEAKLARIPGKTAHRTASRFVTDSLLRIVSDIACSVEIARVSNAGE